jgi:hypothetical protein
LKTIYLICALVCAGIASTCTAEGAAPDWPDSDRNRLVALALTQEINIEILSSHSATRSLEQWCSRYKLADDAVIVAKRNASAEKPATPEQRQQLQVQNDEPIRYRRVQLLCGNRVLSEADNWYVPSRLTPEMNRLLETTDTPFGKVIQPLQPYRLTQSVQRFWPPAENWIWQKAHRHARHLKMPQVLFEHQVLLYNNTHQPISLVDECYQRELLAFPPPR